MCPGVVQNEENASPVRGKACVLLHSWCYRGTLPRGRGLPELMKQTDLVLLLAFQLPLSLLKTAQNHPMVRTVWDSDFQGGPALAQAWGHWAKGEVPPAKPASPPVHPTAACPLLPTQVRTRVIAAAYKSNMCLLKTSNKHKRDS